MAPDDGEAPATDSEAARKERDPLSILRISAALLLLAVFLLLFLLISIGVLTFLLGSSFSVPTQISLPSQCKIVSSGVDIRSSQVCELGLLNYNAKNVFSSSGKRKFRCHYDYYWASVFKVEYKDHLSGQTRLALAEAPNEALPIDCRPSFNTAWLTKDKFKINRTYNCWYTTTMSKVSIYDDDFFSCHAKDPSNSEMLKRCLTLFTEVLSFSFKHSKGARSRYPYWETIAGAIMGFTTALTSLTLLSLAKYMKPLPRFDLIPQPKFLKRACFLVMYLSLTGWLVTQYGKRVGLPMRYFYGD